MGNGGSLKDGAEAFMLFLRVAPLSWFFGLVYSLNTGLEPVEVEAKATKYARCCRVH